MSKRTILFVDDEPNILTSIQRMLRHKRGAWDMLFAGGGKEALEIMAARPVDAIVSDMRMPGMDGPELLQRVMRDYPGVVRFALSGYLDADMVGRSIAPTHQYITKPCTEERLVRALEQALAAGDLVPNKDLLMKVARIEHLPVPPEAYNRISAELAKGDPSPREIGDIVARDMSLSANILKLVNSAYFGLPGQIGTPQQAVIVLGVNVIRSVILSLHIFKSFESLGRSFSMPLLWGHCTRTGAIARTIAKAEGLGREAADHAAIAAMLHDAGKLLLDAQCPEECQRIYAEVRSQNRRVAEVELEQLGLTHAEVGAYLLGLWGLPQAVVHAVASHHAPAAEEPGQVGVADVVHFANLLDHEIFVFNENYATARPSEARLAAIGGPGRYQAWKDAVAGMGLGQEER